MASGLPSWDELNLRLLDLVLSEEEKQKNARDAAAACIAAFGRDSAGDIAHDLGHKLHQHLATALYQDFENERDLVLRSPARQVAALARASKNPADFLYTTNFDPLLELAVAELSERDARRVEWRDLREPRHTTQPKRRGSSKLIPLPTVHHLHGWVDIGGAAHSNPIILAEHQYLDLLLDQRSYPSKIYKRLFADDKASVLIVGMSLADPNLRRFLHARRARRDWVNHHVFALMRTDGRVSEEHVRRYWRSWNVDPILISDYAQLPRVIRDIQWGLESGRSRWWEFIRDWVAKARPTDEVFSDEWQRIADAVLRSVRGFVSTYFEVGPTEQIHLTLFLPMALDGSTPAIHNVVSTRAIHSGAKARAHASSRRLIVVPGSEQGVAGSAFVSGLVTEAINNDLGINRRFTEEMIATWDHEPDTLGRDWRSIVAIPVLDTHHWLTVAVVALTSNSGVPFWTGLGSDDMKDLNGFLRRAAKYLVSEHERCTGDDSIQVSEVE
jgi:ribosomal protein L39E